MQKQGNIYTLEREMALADGLRDVAAELRLIDAADLIALRIREIATEHGIPVIENKTLAQSLYKSVEVDKMIPPEFYKAVAEIVFFLMARQAQTRPVG